MLPLILGGALVAAAIREEQEKEARRKSSLVLGMSNEGSSSGNSLELFQLTGIPGPWENGEPALEYEVEVDYQIVAVDDGDTVYDEDSEVVFSREGKVGIVPIRRVTRGASAYFRWGTMAGGRFVLVIELNDDGYSWDWVGGCTPEPEWWSDVYQLDLTDELAAELYGKVLAKATAMAPTISRPLCNFCGERVKHAYDDGGSGTWEPYCKTCGGNTTY